MLHLQLRSSNLLLSPLCTTICSFIANAVANAQQCNVRQTVYEEMEVDAELQRGLLPGGLALSAKFLPALRAVAYRTGEVIPAADCASVLDTHPPTTGRAHGI